MAELFLQSVLIPLALANEAVAIGPVMRMAANKNRTVMEFAPDRNATKFDTQYPILYNH
jgi:hypothetical protein